MEFEDSRDAEDAVYELNGKDLCGERVIVEHARGPRRDRDGYSYSSRSECGSAAASLGARGQRWGGRREEEERKWGERVAMNGEGACVGGGGKLW